MFVSHQWLGRKSFTFMVSEACFSVIDGYQKQHAFHTIERSFNSSWSSWNCRIFEFQFVIWNSQIFFASVWYLNLTLERILLFIPQRVRDVRCNVLDLLNLCQLLRTNKMWVIFRGYLHDCLAFAYCFPISNKLTLLLKRVAFLKAVEFDHEMKCDE